MPSLHLHWVIDPAWSLGEVDVGCWAVTVHPSVVVNSKLDTKILMATDLSQRESKRDTCTNIFEVSG